MATMLSINLPFAGFYDSWYSHEIDRQEEQDAENRANEDELKVPEHMRLNASELCEIFIRCTDYPAAYLTIARAYVDVFARFAKEQFGFPFVLQFEEMTSPREYNFETDRLFAGVSLKACARMFAMSRKDAHKTLAAVIRERFTSRDGFISSYPNSLDSWLAKPLRDWDHNELGTLLIACFRITGASPDMESEIFDSVADGETFYEAWSNAVDWDKFESLCSEARAEKAEAFADDFPEDAAELAARTYCPDPRQLELPI